MLGIDERELAAIFTVQTAGEVLNYHPHLHGLLADGYWKDGVFTRFAEVDVKAIEDAFAERVLAQLHKRELITDDDVAQILSQDHTGFGVWLGDPFHDKESEQFVARYIRLRQGYGETGRACSPIPGEALNTRRHRHLHH